jgi:hypothetical protein
MEESNGGTAAGSNAFDKSTIQAKMALQLLVSSKVARRATLEHFSCCFQARFAVIKLSICCQILCSKMACRTGLHQPCTLMTTVLFTTS